jgi:hypothetical protein
LAIDSSEKIHVGIDRSNFGAGNDDIMILKFDSSNNHIWSKTWGNNESETGQGLALDSSRYLYITGYAPIPGGGNELFLIKMDFKR